MDQMQTPQSIPHLVQVYQPSISDAKMQNPQIIHISHPSLQTSEGKVTYQQTITSKALQIPVTHVQDISNQPIHMSQNQIVMSCEQTHLQNIHQPVQSQMSQQVVQNPDMSQSLHVILPQVPLFQLSEVQQQYYEQYEPYDKKQCVAKEEPDLQAQVEKQIDCKQEDTATPNEESEQDAAGYKKRNRNIKPNPGTWACNVRKLKHQRGEAYISRRGKFVPERRVRNMKDCLKSCKYKCSARINDTDREHIFKAFYSLNANEKKHFLLNTTERNVVKHNKYPDQNNSKRRHAFKYFFLVRAVRHTVCKNFYLGTLAISQKPVYNVHIGKSEMNIPKPDGRGLSEASAHSLPSELKDGVRKHIMSYKTEDSKPVKRFSKKKQYLEPNLSVKKMYAMYVNVCNTDNVIPVKESMYRKIFRHEFNLHFRKVKSELQLCCKCKSVIKKKS